MSGALRSAVRARAGDRCEYCRIRQGELPFAQFHLEHVVARQHGGSDELDNLAYACQQCNLFKGPNLSSIDPATGEPAWIFNPRQQLWEEHFVMQGALIVGTTPTGRATARLLQMNSRDRVALRKRLLHGLSNG